MKLKNNNTNNKKLIMYNRKSILKICGLEVILNNNIILEDICLTIERTGKIIGIIGPNGGGKTTLLKCILGLININKGKISIFDLQPEKARKYVGYIPQITKFDYDFPISVFDVVLMGRLDSDKLLKGYSLEDKKLVVEALKLVKLIDYSNKKIGELSGGQKQRVFIARALVKNPKLLLMDEPTNGLDSFMQMELYDLLKKLKKKMSIIIVSHDFDSLVSCVDELACLNRTIHFHDPLEITKEEILSTYICPVDLFTHKHLIHKDKPENHICEDFKK